MLRSYLAVGCDMTIVVEDLWKSYGNMQVLKGLNLEVYKGETVVILGQSGVGKSVLLRQIIGIERPDRGHVAVDGNIISSLQGPDLYKAIKNMGMLFQGSALFDSMTVAENTAFYLQQHGQPDTGQPLSKAEIRERVGEALAMVGLEGSEDKMPSDLSGGMRKRAALARLIVYRPRILLYDEPTTGLDPITAMHINELIIKTQQELNATSIVVTHDIRSALEVGDRLALHHNGTLEVIAKKEDFFSEDNILVKSFLNNVTLMGLSKQKKRAKKSL